MLLIRFTACGFKMPTVSETQLFAAGDGTSFGEDTRLARTVAPLDRTKRSACRSGLSLR